MKTVTIISALLLSLPPGLATSAPGGDEPPAQTPLPTSCTLLAMSPAERLAHLERLRLLAHAASAVAVTTEGFRFQVDLQVMPLKELQAWAQAEQECCSFLKIDSQVVEADKRAVVRVVCAEDTKKEVLEAFGLKPQG